MKIPEYRDALKKRFEEKKVALPKLTYNGMALHLGVQSPYLSKVFSQNAHLSTDQLFLACEYLQLSEIESEYFQLLLEYGRSTVRHRKSKMQAQLKFLKQRLAETKEHIPSQQIFIEVSESATYYLEPWHLIVHMGLCIPRYQTDLALLASDLGLPFEKVKSQCEQLVRMGIFRRNGSVLEKGTSKLHLPKNSLLRKPHQNLLRQLCLQKLETLDLSDSQAVAITFTADPDAFDLIQKEFLAFIRKFDNCIDQAETENVYQVNFDLFQWNSLK